MSFYLFNVAFLALAVVCIKRQFAPLAVAAGLLSASFIILSGVHVVASRFTGAGVDQSVLFQLSAGFEGAGWREYWLETITTAVFILTALAFPALLFAKTRKRSIAKPKLVTHLATAALLALIAVHPTVTQTLRLLDYSFVAGAYSATAQSQNSNNLLFEDFFVDPEAAKPAKKKNLIFIYLESFERTYLDNKLFPGLTPHLAALERESLHFTNVVSHRGTGFTIGGLVASQCGLPLLTMGSANAMQGMDQFLPRATCLGDLLAASGTTMSYLGGASLDFAGKGKFLGTHGFNDRKGLKRLRQQLTDPDYLSNWGLYDDSLLDQFRDTHAELIANETPYGLFTLTMDTHHPNGHQSSSCTEAYGDGANKMLNAVHCSDKLIADLIRDIRRSEQFQNTVLVVASDHTALRNSATAQLRKGRRRNLFMVFTPEQPPGRAVARNASTLDIGPTVLAMLGWKDTAIGLGRNLLASQPTLREALVGESVDAQLSAWQDDINAFWEFPSTRDGLLILPKERQIVMQDRRFALPIVIEFDEYMRVRSNVFEIDTALKLPEYLRTRTSTGPFAWIDDCREIRSMDLQLRDTGLCLFIGSLSTEASIVKEINGKTAIEAATLNALVQAKTRKSLGADRLDRLESLKTYGVPDVMVFKGASIEGTRIGAVSALSSSGPKERSFIHTKKGKLSLQRGVNLVSVNEQGHAVLMENLDPCKAQTDINRPYTGDLTVAPSSKTASLFVIVHDSGICSDDSLRLTINGKTSGLSAIGYRTPFIAVLSADGKVRAEYTGERHAKVGMQLGG